MSKGIRKIVTLSIVKLKKFWGILNLIDRELWYQLLALFNIIPQKEIALMNHIKENSKLGDPASIIEAMDHFGWKKGLLMNVGEEKGKILENAVKERSATRVLEIGTYMGYSTIKIALNIPETGKVISIESDPKFTKLALENIERAGLSHKVEIYQGKAEEIIPTLTGTFDLVFIDHLKNKYLSDLKLIENTDLICSSSYVVADNITIFNIQDYLNHVRNSGIYESKYYPSFLEYSKLIPDGVEVSIFK